MKLRPTPQQDNIINFDGDYLLVMSGAGTGKTSVLVEYAKANPRVRMLYVCYNKAIKLEAVRKFPKNVVCRTLHSIAWKMKGVALQHKIKQGMRLGDIKRLINTNDWNIAREIETVFNNYLCSASSKIGKEHATFINPKTSRQEQRQSLIIAAAERVWQAAIDPNSEFPATHDVYLKLYCLDRPSMHKWFGTILFDEAQDANPVVSDWVYGQKTRFIVVGDSHQQLYRWRGAENSMEDFRAAKRAVTMIMNKSFRFGPTVAKTATMLLDYKSETTGSAPFPIEGNEAINDVVRLILPMSMINDPHTRLHRTVSATLATAMNFIHKKVHWIGGIESYNLQEILDVYYFSQGMKNKVQRKKLLVDFNNFHEYKRAADDSEDMEMRRICKLIDDHSDAIPAKLARLRKNEAKDEVYADVTIGTAHRAKGLEWDTVVLADDFPDLLDPDLDMDPKEIADELNLLYVACTRAMKNLQINDIVNAISYIREVDIETPPTANEITEKQEERKREMMKPPVRRQGDGNKPQRIKLGE
jgi:superfamily I DNA/RNA helicase